ncbi:38541_t:CDS:2, partial [Gigaspora margarita]
NDDFKRQVKFKLGLHLLASAGYKLIIEAERLGFFLAKRWTIEHGKKNDYSAEKAYKLFR